MADLDVFYVHTPQFSESGASPFALTIRENNDTNVSFTPSIEFGMRQNLTDSAILRGYLNVGLTYAPTSGREIDAAFVGTDGGDFRTTVPAPDLTAALTAGVQIYEEKSWDLRGEYDLSVGEDFLSQGGRLRLSYRF